MGKVGKHPKAHAASLSSKLPQAIGCYLFALQRGDQTPVPWYVGMTVAIGGFKAEAFQPHKLEIYRQVLEDFPRGGRPVMFFFPLVLRGARYRFGKACVLFVENDQCANADHMGPIYNDLLKMVAVDHEACPYDL